MSDNVRHGIVVQFLVQGFGTDGDFQRRLAIEQLVGDDTQSSHLPMHQRFL